LERPRLIEWIEQNISDAAAAHLTCYNVISLEKNVSCSIGIPCMAPIPICFMKDQNPVAEKFSRSAVYVYQRASKNAVKKR